MAGREAHRLRQVAALPVRRGASDGLEVMLVTSRRTRRWVLPKGNLMRGVSDAKAAAIEAMEEAGVQGYVRKEPYGRYDYWKRRALSFQLCRVDVYLLSVTRETDDWKEEGERERSWFPLEIAARMVLEPGLQSIFRELDRDRTFAQSLGSDRDARRVGSASVSHA